MMININIISIMEIRYLQYFLAVAEELHFGRAAERLHMSQPPLSQQIQKLEKELGTRLFFRTSRKVELTETGKLFLREARLILSQLENSINLVKKASEGRAGQLRIGFNEAAIDSFLSEKIRFFKKDFPEVDLSLCEMESSEQFEALREMKIDIAFPRLFHQNFDGLEYKVLQKEKYCLAINIKHRLAKRKTLKLSDLKSEPLIIFSKITNPLLHNWILSVCHGEGYFPYTIQEANNKFTALALVEAGIGVAFVPQLFMKIKRKNVSYVSIKSKLPVVELAAVWRKNSIPYIVNNFLKYLI